MAFNLRVFIILTIYTFIFLFTFFLDSEDHECVAAILSTILNACLIVLISVLVKIFLSPECKPWMNSEAYTTLIIQCITNSFWLLLMGIYQRIFKVIIDWKTGLIIFYSLSIVVITFQSFNFPAGKHCKRYLI